MQSDKLKGSSHAVRAALVTSTVFATGIAAFLLVGYLDLSSQLQDKSTIIGDRDNQIQEYQTQIAAQRAELEDKSIKLEEAHAAAESLSGQVAERETLLGNTQAELQEQSSKSSSLEGQLADASEKADLLSTEISALQSKIKSDERKLAELTAQTIRQRVTISHYGLGVDQDGNGTVFPIRVEVISPGTGILSVDINNVQYEPGFQTAVRSAAGAAARFTGQSISDKDIVVRFSPDGQASGQQLVKIDGSSAGAIISAMIVSGLTDQEINDSILVTGTISEDGIVGRIAGLDEKLRAAEEFGAEAVLVPISQESEPQDPNVIGVSDIGEVMDRLKID